MNTVGTNSLGFSCSLFEYFQLLLTITFRLLCCSKILKIEVEALSSHSFNSVSWYAWKYVDQFGEIICHWAECKYHWGPYQYILWSPAIWHDLLFWKVCTAHSRGSYITLQVFICKVFGVLGDIPKIVHIYETYLFNWWIDKRYHTINRQCQKIAWMIWNDVDCSTYGLQVSRLATQVKPTISATAQFELILD